MTEMCSSVPLSQSRISANGHAPNNQHIEFDCGANLARETFVVIEGRTLLRDCLTRSLQNKGILVLPFSSVLDFLPNVGGCSPQLVVLSIETLSKQELQGALSKIRSVAPSIPVAVLAEKSCLNDAVEALKMGAAGYISMSTELDPVLEAMHFVSAGGVYLPAECVLAAYQSAPKESAENLTARELAVIHAIRKGGSNKMIAYQLNMCESTVKVHLRHIMKKLHARNRTEVAIRSADIASLYD